VSFTVINFWFLRNWKKHESDIIYSIGPTYTHAHTHTHTHTHTYAHL